MSALCLNRRGALNFLYDMRDSLPVCSGRELKVVFVDGIVIGEGNVDNYQYDFSDMKVGIGGISGKHKFPFSHVDDLSFTRAVVTLFHEYGHYVQDWGSDKSLTDAVSEVSVIGNQFYYQNGWKEFPHEISAEMMGVSLGWNAMESMFPGKADACMLEYVNFRSERTSYMLPCKNGGYQSRIEVEQAFELAMERSLHAPRALQARFLTYRDESVQLLMQGYKNRRSTPNAYHVDMLIDRMTGEQKDKMMASLVIQLHPELLVERPILERADLSVANVFGRPLAADTLYCPSVRDNGRSSRSMCGSISDVRAASLRELDSLLNTDRHVGKSDYDYSL